MPLNLISLPVSAQKWTRTLIDPQPGLVTVKPEVDAICAVDFRSKVPWLEEQLRRFEVVHKPFLPSVQHQHHSSRFQCSL